MSFTFDITNIILIILVIVVIALSFIIFQLQAKMKKFLIGKGSENIDDSFVHINSSLESLEKYRGELETYLETVEKRIKKSVQAVYTVRFNPFKGTTGSGGNQSFATAFLNEAGDGVVVSSLYAREHVSIFSKAIVAGKSEFELSEEEKEAVTRAMNMLKS